MALRFGDDPNREPMMRYQFVTLIATTLLVGASVIGVNLTIVDARFGQVDARFAQVDARFAQVEARLDRLEARMERMERRMDDQFRDMAAGIARLEGLIQGLHGPHAAGTPPPRAKRPA